MVEILEALAYELGDMQLPAGLMLTGGTSLMDGLTELAEQIIPVRVQVGYPKELKGLTDRVNHPMYATGIGLVLYGSALRHQQSEEASRHRPSGIGALMQRVKEWFGY